MCWLLEELMCVNVRMDAGECFAEGKSRYSSIYNNETNRFTFKESVYMQVPHKCVWLFCL